MSEQLRSISPRSRATAEALIVAAEKVGLSARAVRTTTRSYLVPQEVLAEYLRMLSGETEPVSETTEETAAETGPIDTVDEGDFPTSDWKNAEIESWAKANDVDLGGATTKADMLAAISAAAEEKE